MKIELYNFDGKLIAALFSPVALDSMQFNINGKRYRNRQSPDFVFSKVPDSDSLELSVVKYPRVEEF